MVNALLVILVYWGISIVNVIKLFSGDLCKLYCFVESEIAYVGI